MSIRALQGPSALLLAAPALILFPFGWLGDRRPPLGALLGLIFATAREHAVGHNILFALLGATALALWPRLRRRPLPYGALIAGAALGRRPGKCSTIGGRSSMTTFATPAGTCWRARAFWSWLIPRARAGAMRPGAAVTRYEERGVWAPVR